MTKDEALKLALEALKRGESQLRWAAIAAIEEALAQPEQEPVATVIKCGVNRTWMSEALGQLPDGTYDLYTTPPKREWVGLMDAEAQLIYDMGRTPSGMMEMVESKLKEKNA